MSISRLTQNLGMSLLETMVVLSVTAAGGIGVMQVVTQQGKNVSVTNQKDDESYIHQEISQIMSDSASCLRTIGTASTISKNAINLNPAIISSIQKASGNTFVTKYQISSFSSANGVKISSFTIDPASVTAPEGSQQATASFIITFSSLSSNKVSYIKKFTISLTTSAAIPASGSVGITQCSNQSSVNSNLVGNSSDSLWNSSGNNINYTAGKVGIGTTNPSGPLHIQTTNDSANYSAFSSPDTDNVLVLQRPSFNDTSAGRGPVAIKFVGDTYSSWGADYGWSGGRGAQLGKIVATPQSYIPAEANINSLGWYSKLDFYVMGNHRMTIRHNGNIEATAGSFNSVSDARLKKEIRPLEKSLEKILKLNGVTFYWNDQYPQTRDSSNRRQIGLIAQNVEKVFPELVSQDELGFKSLAYPQLVAPIIEAIKEFYNDFKTSQIDLQKLIKINEDWKNRNCEFQKHICKDDPQATVCDDYCVNE